MAATVSFDSLCADLRARRPRPVMVFHGEEGYFADTLAALTEALVPEEDRDFGLTTVYAPQAEALSVVDMCRALPMMTERQVVIVKETQSVRADWVDKLAAYAAAPNPTTVLAVVARGEKLKARKFLKAVTDGGGIVFEGAKVREWDVPRLLADYIKSKGLSVDRKALEMLQDYVGTDLARLYNEVDKLGMILGRGAMITPESVERNVGVSKEYNSFELVDALAMKDASRVFRITDYAAANPKSMPYMLIASTVFAFFSDMLVGYYVPDKSEEGLGREWKIASKIQLRRLREGTRRYNAFQVIECLHAIRQFDAMSKGSGSRQDPYRLLHDLMYRLLTAPGRLPV